MIAGIVIGSIIGALALVLCIPLYGTVELQVEEEFGFRVKLRWLFGAFKRQFPRRNGKAAPNTREPSRPERGQFQFAREMLTDDEARSAIGKLLRGVFRTVKMERLEADFRLGLDDPAATAMVCGPAGAASVLLSLNTDYDIWLLPVFEEATCTGYLQAVFRCRPIRLVNTIARFLISQTGRRITRRITFR